MLLYALRPRLFFLSAVFQSCIWGGARGLELVQRECGGSLWVSLPLKNSVLIVVIYD